jgi:alkanesulfonate monooxygenase SsuD/methylene tetrahydromethanopterin reductase-like flavin-dependent oxidoreductase (luciferase family)
VNSSSPVRSIVLRFDMRSGPQCTETSADRYQAAIDMACWADDNKIDVIGLSEHHDTVDGFLSAPLTLAAMMVARTRRVRISVSALLVPLHDPLRLAEDITLLDIVSNGRFSATCGLGYRQAEYERFGVDWQKRGRVFDEKLAIMVQALGGKAFDYNGGSTQLNPAPRSPVQALLIVGGNSKAAARRAARFGLLFCPAIDDPDLEVAYRAACEEQGFQNGFTIFPREPATTFISQDPDDCWKKIGGHLLYDATAYGAWRHPSRRAYAESFASNLEELKSEGKYRVLSPEQAIQTIKKTGSLHLAPLTGGVPIDIGWQSIRLYEDRVQPYIID